MSLWEPGRDWRLPDPVDARLARLPSAAWLVGLGNLGQACLWSFGLLPYATPGAVRLTLQDFDRITPSNDSTSLLTAVSLVGQYKTRAMAGWAEQRGFTTVIVERRFDTRLRVSEDDPAVALCGVDNGLARAALEDAGFSRIIESGLGNGASDFLAMRMHSFPGPQQARALWKGEAPSSEHLLHQPAYRELASRGADRCGLVRLAGRMVGAPFVGALAGALMVSELVRLANGGPGVSLLDLHLRTPDQMVAVAQERSFVFNPGTTAIRSCQNH
jgi:hypothetical protein